MRNKNWIEFNNKNMNIENMDDKVFANQSNKLKIYKEKKGRKGKTVTLISGFQTHNTTQIGVLLKKLNIIIIIGIFLIVLAPLIQHQKVKIYICIY